MRKVLLGSIRFERILYKSRWGFGHFRVFKGSGNEKGIQKVVGEFQRRMKRIYSGGTENNQFLFFGRRGLKIKLDLTSITKVFHLLI